MMATQTGATWMRLRDGSWGLRGPASMTEGSLVTATRRDGSSSQERVARVLWRGQDEAYATVATQAREQPRVRGGYRGGEQSDESILTRGAYGCADCRRLRRCCEQCRFDAE